MQKQKLIKSNCFFQAIIVFFKFFPNGRIGYDFNSPTRWISFYCDVNKTDRYRFRRKIIRRKKNSSKILFIGHTVIEKL